MKKTKKTIFSAVIMLSVFMMYFHIKATSRPVFDAEAIMKTFSEPEKVLYPHLNGPAQSPLIVQTLELDPDASVAYE